MESQHMTQQTFAQSIGMSPASLSSIFNGRTKPTINIVEAIKNKIPKISTDWLMFGKGEMYVDGSERSTAETSTYPSTSGEPQLDFSSPVSTPSLFAEMENGSLQARQETVPIERNVPKADYLSRTPEAVAVKVIEKPQRRVTEIRLFYDDQTWESFYPERK